MPELTRRGFTGSVVGAGIAAAQIDKRPPNVFFICSDQHNGRIMGPSGHPLAKTPNLDRLAAQGVTFTNAYCGSPVCVPARAALMTGMFPSDVGSYCNSTPFDGRVPTWANRLKDRGYHCWATGKLDLSEGKDYGFVEFKTDHLHSSAPDITSLFRNPLCYRVDKQSQFKGEFRARTRGDEQVVRDTLRFVRQDLKKVQTPWAVYVGLINPHPPFVAHEKYRDLTSLQDITLPRIPPGHLDNMHVAFRLMRNFYLTPNSIPEEDVRSARAAYFALIKELDDSIGQLLDEIDLGNTLIVYTSDHGEMLGEHGLWFKNVLLEDSVRVPLILAGAGLPKDKKIDVPVTHADLVATLVDAGGVNRPRDLRGRSLLPLMHGTAGDHPGYAYSESHSEGNSTGSFMIRKGDWKYIYFSWHDNLLFNLKSDPGELNNLSGKSEFASVEAELHGILTSQVNPDQISERAFQEQDRILKSMVAKHGPQKLYQELVSRLGKGQARALAIKYRKG
jgi:choline-sulfatase